MGIVEPFRKGQVVVFARTKRSTRPGARARSVAPAPNGDSYNYVVDKFWIVAERLDDGRLRLLTRRGKQHLISADDPRLRKPSIWEKLFMRHKFPSPELCNGSTSSTKPSTSTEEVSTA